MVISCPVWGFLPVLAFLAPTLKVPKPINVTVSFLAKASEMLDRYKTIDDGDTRKAIDQLGVFCNTLIKRKIPFTQKKERV